MDPVATLLSRLDNVKRLGAGHTARCPAHEDGQNSLKVDVGDDGQALVHCHAGCSPEAIVRKLGMAMKDLYPPRRDTIMSNGHSPQPHIVATYDYRDEFEDLLYQAVRYDPKDFRQRQPNGRGGWIWNLKDVRRVLYRLPELLGSDPATWVLIVEGEKDADRLAALGLVATTNAMGASKWHADYGEQLRGRRVCLIPDNDPAGEKHIARVARSLMGIAADVRVLRLPDLPPAGDVSDWLEFDGTANELMRLVELAPGWEPTDDSGEDTEATDDGPRFVWSAYELLHEEFPPVTPLVAGIVDQGSATSLFGAGGAGKSWIAISLCLSIATGTPWLDHFTVTQGRVLIVDQEGRPDRVQDRLRRLCGAHELPPDTPLTYARPSGWRVDNELGYAHLRFLIEEHEPDLVLMDSGTRFHNADENKSQEMAAIAQRFAELTTDLGVSLLLIDHANKVTTSDDPRARLRGSTDKINALDAAFFVERKVGETTLNITPVKSRYDAEMPPFAIAFDHGDGLTRMTYEESGSMSATPDDALAAIHRLSADDPYGATLDSIGFSIFPTPAMTSSQRNYRTRGLLKILESQRRIVSVDVPRDGSRGGRKIAYQAREIR